MRTYPLALPLGNCLLFPLFYYNYMGLCKYSSTIKYFTYTSCHVCTAIVVTIASWESRYRLFLTLFLIKMILRRGIATGTGWQDSIPFMTPRNGKPPNFT